MSRAGGAFLGGAASRLLPASIPMRYFGAAAAFHLLGWLALLAGARDWPGHAGGLGWPLAALHLFTLGVLVMTAIGASLQLLPVATRQPVPSAHGPALVWWLYTPGVAAVALGMGTATPALLAAGAAAVLVALAGYAALLVLNLIGARGMAAVVAHVWAALAALAAVGATALALVLPYVGVPLLDRATALALHLVFAAYGFMGLLSLGLACILVPMFALSPAPSERQAMLALALALAALLAAAAAAFGAAPQALRGAAVLLGVAAALVHLRQMHAALRAGMRRELGGGFVLVRIGWACLPGSLVAAGALAMGAPWPALPRLFVLLLIGGWLLSFLFGILQRILPFLASMHVGRSGKRPPTPGALTNERALAVHRAAHLAALALLAAACVWDSPWLPALAAMAGTAGAIAFGVFYVELLRRRRAATPTAANRDGAT